MNSNKGNYVFLEIKTPSTHVATIQRRGAICIIVNSPGHKNHNSTYFDNDIEDDNNYNDSDTDFNQNSEIVSMYNDSVMSHESNTIDKANLTRKVKKKLRIEEKMLSTEILSSEGNSKSRNVKSFQRCSRSICSMLRILNGKNKKKRQKSLSFRSRKISSRGSKMKFGEG